MPHFSPRHDRSSTYGRQSESTDITQEQPQHLAHQLTPYSVNQSDEILQDPFGASSLLWPDSEDFFRNVMSFDATAWDQSMAVMNSVTGLANTQPQRPAQSANNASPYDECPSAEDGERAVQTVNGLISNTVSVRNRSTSHRSCTATMRLRLLLTEAECPLMPSKL